MEFNESIDLFYARNQNQNDQSDDEMPVDEDYEPKLNFDSILEQLNDKYSEIVEDISLVVDKKSPTQGIWNPELRSVEIINEKHLKQYVPVAKDSKKYLSAFEALFLLECRSLAIFYKNISLSIEDAYHFLLRNIRDHKLYKIFSVLSRVGYYVCHLDKKLKPIASYQPKNFGTKRSADEDNQSLDIGSENKKMDFEKNHRPQENYSVINNIRPLKLSHIPKIDKIDQELIKHFKEEEKEKKNSSKLFCVKKSSQPTNISPLLSPLQQSSIKPVISTGSIYNTDKLFESIQMESPISNDYFLPESLNLENNNIDVDFLVYSSRKHMNDQQERPLFKVMVVDDVDLPLISINDISRLIHSSSSSQASPIYFAILSQILDYNFYSLEKLKMKNIFPRLWERQER